MAGGRSIRTARNRKLFLATLAESASVTRAAAAIKCGRTSAYQWRNEDPEFAAEWDQAVAEVLEKVEERVFADALFDDGPVGAHARAMLLRYRKPEVYNPGLLILHRKLELDVAIRRAQLEKLTVEGQALPAPVDGAVGADGVINNVEIVPARRFRLPDNARGRAEEFEDGAETEVADVGEAEPQVIEDGIANAAD